MAKLARHTLYICYFGLRQPLVQTQVIPYLTEIAKGGYRVSLLTFEPEAKQNWTSDDAAVERTKLASLGIEWDFLPYHKRPTSIATAWDILAGMRYVRRKIRGDGIDILHGRVHVATLIGALARKFSRRKPKLIFDIRGFFPEEYVDAGVWAENKTLFRAAKRVERWLMSESDGFVVLTEKARQMVLASESRPVEVIPCCVDLQTRFTGDHAEIRQATRERLGITDRKVFTHVGALGGLYLTEELTDLIATAREVNPSVFAMFLTQSDPAEVRRLLRVRGFGNGDFFAGRVDSNEIPAYLAASDVGLSFVKATYATQSRSPTKIPEYLAAGLPIIANAGVGDVDSLIRTEGVGVLIDSFDRASYRRSLAQLAALGDIADRCRDTARTRFDLASVGGERYRRLYAAILQS